jgi:GNAT superfamily N-acetyltransferase
MLVFNRDATVRKATPDDLGDLLTMYDEAVEWLNARGITDQWGMTPVTERPCLVNEIASLIDCGYVAECTEILGFIALNDEMPDDAAEYAGNLSLTSGLYIHTLVARGVPAARGAGALLLQYAEGIARNTNSSFLALTCWAGNPRLVQYYKSRGFERCNAINENDGHREQLFLKRL